MQYLELIEALRWDALNCTRVVSRNIEEDCTGAANALEEVLASNEALVIALGVSHKMINELTMKLEAEVLTTAAHKKSQGYAYEELAKVKAEHSFCLDLMDKLIKCNT